MPNIKSAKKRVKVAKRNYERNHAHKSAIRTAFRRVQEGVKDKVDAGEIQTRVAQVYSLVDKAVLKGILHKNTGARFKARTIRTVR